jgi:hypothetical protein
MRRLYADAAHGQFGTEPWKGRVCQTRENTTKAARGFAFIGNSYLYKLFKETL